MTQDQSRLLRIYRSLPYHERKAADLMSVIVQDLPYSTLLKCMNAAGIRTARGVQYTGPKFKRLLTRWIENGLVEDLGNRYRGNPAIREPISRALALDGKFESFARASRKAVSYWGAKEMYDFYYDRIDGKKFYQDLRKSVHLNNTKQFRRMLDSVDGRKFSASHMDDRLARLFAKPIDREWLESRRVEIREFGLRHIVATSTPSLKQLGPAMEILQNLERQSPDGSSWRWRSIVEDLLLAGRFEEAMDWLPRNDPPFASLYLGWVACVRGDPEEAVRHFESAIELRRKAIRKREIVLPGLPATFYILALLGTGDNVRIRRARDYANLMLKKDSQGHGLFLALRCLADFAEGKADQAKASSTKAIDLSKTSPLEKVFIFIALCRIDPRLTKKRQATITRLRTVAVRGGTAWASAELACVLGRLKAASVSAQEGPKDHRRLGSKSLLDLIQEREPWERSLAALGTLSETVKRPRTQQSASRLVWRLDGEQAPTGLRPYEQRVGKTGRWTAGRVVALKRLLGRSNVPFMTGQDGQICDAIKIDYQDPKQRLHMDVEQAVKSLIGHPLVFRGDDPKVRVEVVQAEPQLRVETMGRRVRITLVPKPPAHGGVRAVLEIKTRLVVTTFQKAHEEIYSLLGQKGLNAPLSSKDRIVRAISSLSSLVTVHSDIGGGESDAAEVKADPRPHFLLTPHEDGLRAEAVVQPFVDSGPTYTPGKGGEVVFAIVKRVRTRTRRDRVEEVRQFDSAVAACPALSHGEWDGRGWTLPDAQASLELVDGLHSLGNQVVVSWPRGESFKIRQHAAMNQLFLKVRRSRDWFRIEGEVKFDAGLVMQIRELLNAVEDSEGRFVQVGEKEFVALSERFQQRVKDLAAFADKHGKGLRFHRSRSHALEGLVEGAGSIDGDRAWSACLRQFRKAQALDPEVPSTLQADLRDYQVAGFRWAARLAAWGAGACLADDMGLGKTVQALSVILERAPAGPALVIAPTSVCPNWIDEVRRFTPTLNPLLFGHGNREKMIDGVGPFDVLICSYGLLRIEIEKLAGVKWETVVLDEAQAIKNRDTQRSRAAMKLSGSFRMITTGTPIENHLGELWNLFRFINPGLLGSARSFSERFATPIHQHGSAQAKLRLKRLIQPFILRRTKSAVLHELPPKTEITIRVKMSEEERSLYEAVRRNAIDALSTFSPDGTQGHLQILAQIMKLRRACCHPQLVMPDSEIPASKLESFGYTVADLIDSGHKALVFSQFVGHLEIVRSHLDRKGIDYRYLDGSTPLRERKRQVDAFQAGRGDLFLISLKAGGQGLNLTAADYVLHLDPWWNPAVEDQASDRAHRIGQVRPVTIYRFVMKDTIEERIVDLHASKRDIADSLLEGADMSGKMTADELLALVRES